MVLNYLWFDFATMTQYILDILQITGALTLFIFGMKIMSDGIQKAAGGQLRRTLRNVTKKPVQGVLVGLLTTGIMQSSSATTVMTISFVNAGLITVAQSASIIMGANIGTTITAWLVSLGGFLFKLSSITVPLLTIAVPFYLRGGKRNKYWAEALIGFCLLFIGLDFLKESLPSIEDRAFYEMIKNYTSMGFGSRILFVIIGILITIIVQSSSAAMTLTLALVFNGLLPVDLGCAMIIGENIGTTITAEIAALVGNMFARQSATVHSLFNIIGAVWMIFFLGPVISLLESVFELILGQDDPFTKPQLATIGLASFHTTFNLLNTLLLIPFIDYLVKAASTIRRQRSKKDLKTKLRYMDTSIGTPELSAVEIKSEILEFSEIVTEMVQDSFQMLTSIEVDEQLAIQKKLKKKDKKNRDYIYSIRQYVIQLAKEELTEATSDNLQRYISITEDLNRISNLTVNVTLELKDRIKQKLWFTPVQRDNLIEMYQKVFEGLEKMSEILNMRDSKTADFTPMQKIEDELNELRDRFRSDIASQQGEFDFNINGTLIYFRLITLVEKIGDKIYDLSRVITED